MDKFEQLIEDIRVELNSLTNGAWPASRWVFGKLKKEHQASLPRIEWEEAGGAISTVEKGTPVGSNTGNIAADSESFDVTFWNKDREACRTSMHNLLLAARTTAFGPNVLPGAYRWVEDANVNSGRKLRLRLTLKIGVSTEVMPEAPVETHGHSIEVNGEEVC